MDPATWAIISAPVIAALTAIVTARITSRSADKQVTVSGFTAFTTAQHELIKHQNEKIDDLEKTVNEAKKAESSHGERLLLIEQGLWRHQEWDRDVMRKARDHGIDLDPPPPILPLPRSAS